MVIERGGLTPNTARFTASRDPAALADRGKGGLKYLHTVNRPVSEFGKMQDMTKKMYGNGLMMKKLAGIKGMQVGYKILLNL